MLSRSNNSVRWRVIAGDITGDIQAGTLRPGAKLQTEKEYSSHYAVNRQTVRRALRSLQERGLVEVTQGRGSFVCRPPPVEYHVSRSVWLDEIIKFERDPPSAREPGYAVQRANSEIARALGIDGRRDVIAIEKIGYAHDQPVALSSHFLALADERRCCDFITAFENGATIGEALASCGAPRASRRKLDIAARRATPREMERLDLPRHAPLIIADSVILDGANRPIEFNRARLASDRVRITFDADER